MQSQKRILDLAFAKQSYKGLHITPIKAHCCTFPHWFTSHTAAADASPSNFNN